MNRIIVFAVLASTLAGCADYRAGDCAQNPKDGYIYRITSVQSGKYTVQGWLGQKWGIPTETAIDFLKDRYVKVTCPFSTEVVSETKR